MTNISITKYIHGTYHLFLTNGTFPPIRWGKHSASSVQISLNSADDFSYDVNVNRLIDLSAIGFDHTRWLSSNFQDFHLSILSLFQGRWLRMELNNIEDIQIIPGIILTSRTTLIYCLCEHPNVCDTNGVPMNFNGAKREPAKCW